MFRVYLLFFLNLLGIIASYSQVFNLLDESELISSLDKDSISLSIQTGDISDSKILFEGEAIDLEKIDKLPEDCNTINYRIIGTKLVNLLGDSGLLILKYSSQFIAGGGGGGGGGGSPEPSSILALSTCVGVYYWMRKRRK